jgi:hypothetical protein
MEELGKLNSLNITLVSDEERVRVMTNLGYPVDYVRKTLKKNEANYCLAGYYLLGID